MKEKLEKEEKERISKEKREKEEKEARELKEKKEKEERELEEKIDNIEKLNRKFSLITTEENKPKENKPEINRRLDHRNTMKIQSFKRNSIKDLTKMFESSKINNNSNKNCSKLNFGNNKKVHLSKKISKELEPVI